MCCVVGHGYGRVGVDGNAVFRHDGILRRAADGGGIYCYCRAVMGEALLEDSCVVFVD